MVDVAQQVRASDCGSEGRRFEPDLPPTKNNRNPVVFLCPYGLDLRIESYCRRRSPMNFCGKPGRNSSV